MAEEEFKMEILGEMKIIDCGKSGQARKLLYILGKKIYTYYCYFGNPTQDFVIDDKENIISDKKLENEIMRSGRNYIYYKYVKENGN